MSEKQNKTLPKGKQILMEINNLNLRSALRRFCQKAVEENLDMEHLTIPMIIIKGNMSQYFARVVRTMIKTYGIDLNVCKEMIS